MPATQLSPAEPAGTPLSRDELAIAGRQPLKRAPCVLETDATLRFGGREIECTLRAYGKWCPHYPGDSGGKGERRLSPPEPAGFEISAVTISTSGPEVEVDFALDSKAIEAIAEAAAEECDE